jgi:hypothetical protein
MSVLCTLTNGWIISHDHFVRCLYERLEGIAARRFEFDHSFFEINTPFVRSCVNKDNSVHHVNCLASPPRKRQKKRENEPINIDVSKNMYILVGKPLSFQRYSSVLEKCPVFFHVDTYLFKLLVRWKPRFRFIINIFKGRVYALNIGRYILFTNAVQQLLLWLLCNPILFVTDIFSMMFFVLYCIYYMFQNIHTRPKPLDT